MCHAVLYRCIVCMFLKYFIGSQAIDLTCQLFYIRTHLSSIRNDEARVSIRVMVGNHTPSASPNETNNYYENSGRREWKVVFRALRSIYFVGLDGRRWPGTT